MVQLVLNAHGQCALSINLAHGARGVLCTYFYRNAAFYTVINVGHAQAAFVAFLRLGAGPSDFGVNQHHRLVALLAYVDHD